MTEQEFQYLSALMNGRTDELTIQEIQRLEKRGWITTYIFNEFTQSGLRAFELEENARNQRLQQAYT